jgi:hypothetical protein
MNPKNGWSEYYTPPTRPDADARPRDPNGLFTWDPLRDSCAYWAQPLPVSKLHATQIREALARPLTQKEIR